MKNHRSKNDHSHAKALPEVLHKIEKQQKLFKKQFEGMLDMPICQRL